MKNQIHMKLLRKAFLLGIISSFLVACDNSDTEIVAPEIQQTSKDIDFKSQGYDVSLIPYRSESLQLNSKKASLTTSSNVSSVEEFKMTVSKQGKRKEAIILKENIGKKENNDFNLYHYDVNNQLIATIVVKSNLIADIVLPSSNIATRKAASSRQIVAAAQQEGNCFESGYMEYKDFYSQGDWREIACDLGDLFAGACTLAGILAGAINCL